MKHQKKRLTGSYTRWIVPAMFAVVIGFIGNYYLTASHADTYNLSSIDCSRLGRPFSQPSDCQNGCVSGAGTYVTSAKIFNYCSNAVTPSLQGTACTDRGRVLTVGGNGCARDWAQTTHANALQCANSSWTYTVTNTNDYCAPPAAAPAPTPAPAPAPTNTTDWTTICANSYHRLPNATSNGCAHQNASGNNSSACIGGYPYYWSNPNPSAYDVCYASAAAAPQANPVQAPSASTNVTTTPAPSSSTNWTTFCAGYGRYASSGGCGGCKQAGYVRVSAPYPQYDRCAPPSSNTPSNKPLIPTWLTPSQSIFNPFNFNKPASTQTNTAGPTLTTVQVFTVQQADAWMNSFKP